jgi:hypothetical protein
MFAGSGNAWYESVVIARRLDRNAWSFKPKQQKDQGKQR